MLIVRVTGPIVRITPDELHIQDSSFYEKLYSSTEPRDKYSWMAGRFGAPAALPVTLSHTLHAERRAALAPLFKASSIEKLEPLIWASAEQLCEKIAGYANGGDILPLQKAWVAYAGDVVTEAMLAHSYGYVASEGFEGGMGEALQAAGETGPLVLQFPLIMTIVNSLPDAFVGGVMEPRMKKLLALQAVSFAKGVAYALL
jgi:hypothetical protein